MKILTLNVDMFNLQIDDSFEEFIKSYDPDIAVVQEYRANHVGKSFEWIPPIRYVDVFSKIDARVHLTVASCKKMKKDDSPDLGKYNRCCIAFKQEDNKDHALSLLGVHVPIEKDENDEFNRFMSFIDSRDFDIICGDFNASDQNPKSKNYKLLTNLKQGSCSYLDLWDYGVKNGLAYYVDYAGNQKEVKESTFVRTYAGNRHIDYILGKAAKFQDEFKVKSIIIDMRTLAFTDHCAIILDCEPIPANNYLAVDKSELRRFI